MKKLLVAATVAGSLISSMAFAKTEGNYIGVDLLATQAKQIFNTTNKEKEIDFGVGVNYKHAINFDGFFVAPGVYFDFNNASVNDGPTELEAEYSYGLVVDLGYDINDKIAAYVALGYKEARLTTSSNNVDTASQTEELITYGIGTRYSLNEDLDLNLSYEYGDYVGKGISSSVNTDIVRLGVAYNF